MLARCAPSPLCLSCVGPELTASAFFRNRYRINVPNEIVTGARETLLRIERTKTERRTTELAALYADTRACRCNPGIHFVTQRDLIA